jgi:predicted membrane chloride channel (bestrophin family)
MASRRRRNRPASAKISKRQVLNKRDGITQFCARCTVMIKIMSSPKEASAIRKRGFPHHDLSSLSASARTGCPFCFWLHLGNYLHWVTHERSLDRIYIRALDANERRKSLSELRRSDRIVATMNPDSLSYRVKSTFNISCISIPQHAIR